VAHLPRNRAHGRCAWIGAGLMLFLLALTSGSLHADETPDACIMKLEGAISQALSKAIIRKIEEAEKNGVKTFILELNTPGGTIQDSTELGDFIFQREDIDVIAYIHPKAYSGGTMVALACKEIYIDAAVGMMGDVAPVAMGAEILGEKVQSPLRKTLLNYAAKRGYPDALVKAMVTKELEVFRVETADDPRPRFITGDQFDALPEEEKAKILKGKKELIVPAGQLLTMNAADALEYGFAKEAVGSTQALFDTLQIKRGKVQRLYLTGSERLLAFLDMFSPLLIIGGFVLIFLELNNPGFGLPGILGIGCFVVFFLIKWTLHYARLLELILFVAGLAFLMVEMFFIPGFGVVGAAGLALMFISLVLMFQEFGLPGTERETTVFLQNLLKVTVSLAGSAIGIAVLLHFIPSLPGLGRLVLRQDLAAAHAGEMLEFHTPGLAQMVGEVGISVTPLRPAGRAEFGDALLDVVTEGEFIETGSRVQIHQIRGNRIVVRPYREV